MIDQITRSYTNNNEWEFDHIDQDFIKTRMNKTHLSLTNNDSDFIVMTNENAVVELKYESSKCRHITFRVFTFHESKFSFRNL